jgi:hypothetical protein
MSSTQSRDVNCIQTNTKRKPDLKRRKVCIKKVTFVSADRNLLILSETTLKFIQKQFADLYVPMHTDKLFGY